jgi:ATP-binding cassette subfamily C (CFTR/MRP) protein 1
VRNLIIDSSAQESQPDRMLNISEDIQKDLATGVVKNSEQEEDLLRKTGDVALYKYYLKSVGWKDGIAILALTIGAQFCVYFPRQYQSCFLLRFES